MKQVLFRIPGVDLPVYGFGLMVLVAFYAGLALAIWRSKQVRLDPNLVYDIAVFMLVGGVIGARLVYVVEYWGETVHTFGQIFRVWEGGVVFHGGAVGGFAGLFLLRLLRPFPLLATLDAVSPSIALGAAFGRIGCFLNGCCYGRPCDLPGLSVQFPAGSPPWLAQRARELITSDAPLSLPVHPTQIYSAIDGLVLFALLTAYYPVRRRDGEVFSLLLIGYSILRFFAEILRDDEAPLRSGFTIAQTLSGAFLFLGLALWSKLSEKPPGRYADLPAPSDGPV